MQHYLQHYIDGRWVDAGQGASRHTVINPATEQPVSEVALGRVEDVDAAVNAARDKIPNLRNGRAFTLEVSGKPAKGGVAA